MKTSRRDFVKNSVIGAGGLAFGTHHMEFYGLRHTDDAGKEFKPGMMDMDLLKDGSAWTSFSHREEITPSFSRSQKGGVIINPSLVINGNNNSDSMGCWLRPLPKLLKGRRYSIEASFMVDRVENISKSIKAVILREKGEYYELYMPEKVDNWYRLSGEFVPDHDEEKLELCLYLIESGTGTVHWNNIKIKDITDSFKPRLVKVSAISGRPSGPKDPEEAIRFYCNRIDEIRDKNLDLIVLPENINVDRVPGDRKVAESIPGPSTDLLGEKAREYNTYITASLSERDGRVLYNTAVLIDRSGKLIGKYRKVHLTLGENLVKGLKPGNEYPVFQTDFGKIGMMICYDNHFQEVARILAVKGADIIAFSNDSDGREWTNGERGSVWDPYMRIRAVDNHLAIVAAVNGGRSAIVNGSGEILAANKRSNEEPGGIIQATVDLNASVINGRGRMIQKRYLMLRHPDTYEELTKHSWDFE